MPETSAPVFAPALEKGKNALLELSGLAPEPAEEWQRMLRFAALGDDDQATMSRSVEVLFRRGAELVVGTYDYLRSVPETAAILGWDESVDEAHLGERRRFFTIWLARTLGLDTSDEFAYYLFRAGKLHAGHGPRRIHTPPAYVNTSVGLVLAAFSRFMSDAQLSAEIIASAMAGWSKYLTAQQNQMDLGYRDARAVDRGAILVHVSLFGRLRPLTGIHTLEIKVEPGDHLHQALRKFFDYFPQTRAEALERTWRSLEKPDVLWMEVQPVYVPRRNWRILLNGRDVEYEGGLAVPLSAGDEIALFPPGR
jgi:molybdopterin converting factor small subunit